MLLNDFLQGINKSPKLQHAYALDILSGLDIFSSHLKKSIKEVLNFYTHLLSSVSDALENQEGVSYVQDAANQVFLTLLFTNKNFRV